MSRRTIRSRQGSISEFPLALTVLMLMGVFPLIDLTAIALGAASSCLVSHQAATVVSSKRRYSDCLQSMTQESGFFMQSGFAKFLRMQPIGGYQGSGADLFVEASNYRSAGAVQTFGPNTPVPPPVDQSTYVYECTVAVKYQVGPFLNLSGVPFIGAIPGLGKPAILNFQASRAAEFPTGLEGDGSIMEAGQAAPSFDTTASPNTVPSSQLGSSGSGWNYPNIYSLIAQAGQTVVASEVVSVPANANQTQSGVMGNWTPTAINVAQGQYLWIDLRSEGMWNMWPASDPYTNGNGINGLGMDVLANAPMSTAQYGALIGKVGNASPFLVGTSYMNYAPGKVGPVTLISNDNTVNEGWSDDLGVQLVRVILTQ